METDTYAYNPQVNMQQPKDNPYDYQVAIRNRLAQINDMGTQQNQYVQQKAMADQQKRLEAQRQAMMAAASQQQGASVGGDSGADYGTGQGAQANNPNPRSVAQALAFAKQAAANGDSSWYRRCLAFVASAYGLAGSGSNRAIDAYNLAANQKRIVNSGTPNVGSVVYWNTGQGKAGHAALYAGNGMIYSNDIGGAGRISLVPIGDISKKWGSQYLGWSDPYFASSPRR